MLKIATVLVFLSGLLPGFAQPFSSLGIQHVAVIGIDGLSIDGVRSAQASHLQALMMNAAWTLEARGVMPTLSSPNWESMITGSSPEQHGITSNGYLHQKIELKPSCLDAEGKFPTIFEVLRQQRPSSRIAVIHDWDGFADLLEKQVPDVLQHERGPEKTTDAALKEWNEHKPTLLFVHLDNVDHAGHVYGWGSKEYLEAVAEADRCAGRLLDALLASPDTLVLVTSDHGGKGKNHGKNSLVEIQIPWILAGAEVAPGKLSAPVNTYDTAATIAWVFGLQTPACWIARPVVSAFRADAVARLTHKDVGTCADPAAPVIGGNYDPHPAPAALGKGGH